MAALHAVACVVFALAFGCSQALISPPTSVGTATLKSCQPIGNCPSNCILGREEGSGCYLCICAPCNLCCQGYCYGPLVYDSWRKAWCPSRCCATSQPLTLTCCRAGNCQASHEWWYQHYGW